MSNIKELSVIQKMSELGNSYGVRQPCWWCINTVNAFQRRNRVIGREHCQNLDPSVLRRQACRELIIMAGRFTGFVYCWI